MKLTKILRAAVTSGEAPGFTALCLFTVASGGLAMLNDASGGDPRFTLFAGCLCVLGASALAAFIAVLLDVVWKLNDQDGEES